MILFFIVRTVTLLKFMKGKLATYNKKTKITFQKNISYQNPYDKGDYQHFMLKEIHEQPGVLKSTQSKYTAEYFVDFKTKFRHLFEVDKIVLVGCGTAYHASMVGEYYFNHHKHLYYLKCRIYDHCALTMISCYY